MRRYAWLLAGLLGGSAMNRTDAAESFIVVDAGSGYVFAAKAEDEPRPVASLTKIATVVVALEWLKESEGDAGELMSVSADAVSSGVNPLTLAPGDAVSLESAIFASMMASDNTSAYVLAEHIGRRLEPDKPPSEAVAVFVDRMNRLAARLGMADTRFVNPHGLDEPGAQGVSTAADMARLAIHAYGLPDFASYGSAKEREVSIVRGGSETPTRLINTNDLVGSRGIDGTKTGTTWRAGECLVASGTAQFPEASQETTRRIISVVLKAEERFRETVLLFNEAWTAYEDWLRRGEPIGPNESLLMPGN
ncbi:MAG: serine hydrolase [Verrucomicrobiales bacterium]